jgi:hypothetical protein
MHRAPRGAPGTTVRSRWSKYNPLDHWVGSADPWLVPFAPCFGWWFTNGYLTSCLGTLAKVCPKSCSKDFSMVLELEIIFRNLFKNVKKNYKNQACTCRVGKN